ncbi:MAG: hypothetical protein MSJ26_10490 [Oscillospiraceae bacterium]|nr:hypothetical protein [Oscillospiraceae bacterium]
MNKALKILASSNTNMSFILSPIAAVLLPLPMIFAHTDHGLGILCTFGLLAIFLSAGSRLVIYPITGPSPAEPKTLKWAANNRTMMNGAYSGYDMVCLFPTTRKQLFRSFFKVWLPVILITATETAAAVIFNFTEAARGVISSFSLCFALIVIAIPNIYYYKPKNQYFAMVLIITGFLLSLIYMMISTVTDIIITVYLPAPAAVILPIAAIIYNIIFYAKTAMLGDFARNGEKII